MDMPLKHLDGVEPGAIRGLLEQDQPTWHHGLNFIVLVLDGVIASYINQPSDDVSTKPEMVCADG